MIADKDPNRVAGKNILFFTWSLHLKGYYGTMVDRRAAANNGARPGVCENMEPRLAKGMTVGSAGEPRLAKGMTVGSAAERVGPSSQWAWAWKSPWSGDTRESAGAVPSQEYSVSGGRVSDQENSLRGSEPRSSLPKVSIGRNSEPELLPSGGSRGAEFLVEAASMFAGSGIDEAGDGNDGGDELGSPASQAGSFFGFTSDARLGGEEGMAQSDWAGYEGEEQAGIEWRKEERGESDESSTTPFFSVAQVDEFRDAFRLLDRDGDGFIGEEDVTRVLGDLDGFEDPGIARGALEEAFSRSLLTRNRSRSPGAPQYTPRGRNPTPVHPIMSPKGFVHGSPETGRRAHHEGDSRVPLYLSWEDFLNVMEEKVRRTSAEQQLREAFNVFDRNGDDGLDRAELRRLFEALSGRPIEVGDVQKLLDGADLNHDGRIGFSEFRELMVKVHS